MPKIKNGVLCLIPVIFLATIFWKPIFFDHKSIIHGDSIVDGLSLLSLQANSFRHLGQLLWADGVYGGHPLFAESQGAFASPFNMIIAWIVAPLFGTIFAMNFAHWLSMILIGGGVIGLCRCLGAGLASSCFAAIAVVFSPIWILDQQNLTISGCLTWVPWAFWAIEEWLRRPAVKSAVLLGGAVAMTILSGYPQTFHGTVIYMAVILAAIPFQGAARRLWMAEWRVRASTGVIALATCVGLSAVQWLPLLELAGLSHRNNGIGIFMAVPLTGYLRGFLYTWQRIGGSGDYFPGMGSLLTLLLASLSLVVGIPGRVKAHLFAALVLVQLGGEEASPLFRLVYHHNLIPGLRYFRTVHLYLNVAVIGFAVLAAFAIDGLSRYAIAGRNFVRHLAWGEIIRVGAGIVIVCLAAYGAWLLWVPDLSWANIAPAIAAVFGGGALILRRRPSWIPLFMVALLTAECMSLRLHPFHFYDPSALSQPASVAAITRDPAFRDSRLLDDSTAAGYSFTDSRALDLVPKAKRMMASISPLTNTLWGLRSINGALALPMRRQVEAETLMRAEIAGQTASPAGARLIDLLAVRFISLDQAVPTPAFRPFWEDGALNARIMENTAARSRFQLYTRHVAVGSADEALETIKTLKTPTLVIENPPSHPQPEAADDTDPSDGGPADDRSTGSFTILKAKSTEYRVDVTTGRPGWFFVADADYPGWKATLDGKPVPLFPAQLLGKAVAVPAGTHRIEIAFKSTSFRVGLIVSLLSVVAALIFWIRGKPRNESAYR